MIRTLWVFGAVVALSGCHRADNGAIMARCAGYAGQLATIERDAISGALSPADAEAKLAAIRESRKACFGVAPVGKNEVTQ